MLVSSEPPSSSTIGLVEFGNVFEDLARRRSRCRPSRDWPGLGAGDRKQRVEGLEQPVGFIERR